MFRSQSFMTPQHNKGTIIFQESSPSLATKFPASQSVWNSPRSPVYPIQSPTLRSDFAFSSFASIPDGLPLILVHEVEPTLQSKSSQHYTSTPVKVLDTSSQDEFGTESCWSDDKTLVSSACKPTLRKSRLTVSCSTDESSISFIGTLGRGAYGKVLLATSSAEYCSGGLLAVKVLQKHSMLVDDVRELKRELGTLNIIAECLLLQGSCSHREDGLAFLQKSYGSVQDPGFVYINMEYHVTSLCHPEIRSRLRLYNSGTPDLLSMSISLPIAFSSHSVYPPIDEALHALRLLAAELVLGLSFLHAQGIVHQDIKPSNVLVSAAGHVVIGDFGSARMLPRNNANVSQDAESVFSSASYPANHGAIVIQPEQALSFTPDYAAPELMSGDDGVLVYDARIDMWSLGVMLREFASGHRPGSRGGRTVSVSENDISKAEIGNDFDFDSTDEAFDSFTMMLLAHDQEERLYGSAVQMHPFFAPITNIWQEIALLQHPPLPDPVWADMDDDTTLELNNVPQAFADKLNSAQRLFTDIDLRIPWIRNALPSGPLSQRSSDSLRVASWMLARPATPCPPHDIDNDALTSCTPNTIEPLETSCTWLVPVVSDSDGSCTSAPLMVSSETNADVDTIVSIGIHTPRLRRRHRIHNLRHAYLNAGEPDYAIPVPVKSSPVQQRLLKPIVWTFEQEVTVALLIAMESSPPLPAHVASEQGLRRWTKRTFSSKW